MLFYVFIWYLLLRCTCTYCVSAKEEKTCCSENSVKVHANGSCVWYREYQLSVTHCPVDVTWFPFDEQNCEIKFESKTRESKELNITYMSSRTNRSDSYFETSAEWNLVGKPQIDVIQEAWWQLKSWKMKIHLSELNGKITNKRSIQAL